MRDRAALWAALGVLTGWAAAVIAAWGIPPHDLDPTYLSSLEAIAQGGEAPRPWRHLSWGVLHTFAHLGWTAEAWREGRMGVEMTLLATLSAPFAGWVTWRIGAALKLSRIERALGASIVAWGPSALMVAGMGDTLPRWLGTGLALLGVAVWLEAVDRERAGPLAVLRVVLLQALAIAWHPSAIIVTAVAAPLWLGQAWAQEKRVGAIVAALVLLGGHGAVGLAWVAASGQSGVVESGVGFLLPGLVVQPRVALALMAWQLPGVGRLAPVLGTLIPAVIVGLLLVAALAQERTRRVGLLGLGCLAALLPEIGAAGYVPDPAVAWSVGPVQAGMVPAIGGGLLAALVCGRLLEKPRGAWIVGLLLALMVPRAGMLLQAKRAGSQGVAEAQLFLAREVLVAHLRSENPESEALIAGDIDLLNDRFKDAKWLPETPEKRRKIRFELAGGDKAIEKRAEVALARRLPDWIDGALWETSVHLCHAWLGRPFTLDTECNPDADHVWRVNELPDQRCYAYVHEGGLEGRCGVVPWPEPAAETREGNADLWATNGLVVFVLGLLLGWRREG